VEGRDPPSSARTPQAHSESIAPSGNCTGLSASGGNRLNPQAFPAGMPAVK